MAPSMDTVFVDGALQGPLPVGEQSPHRKATVPPLLFTEDISYHRGADIADLAVTPILAAAGGTVIVANATDSWGGGYGYCVKINHGGGSTTLYALCFRISVAVSQQIKAGEVIGYVGQTGRSTGAHLHFEISS